MALYHMGLKLITATILPVYTFRTEPKLAGESLRVKHM